MHDEGGILTHGRLPENVDRKARKDLKLADPRKLRSKGRRVPKGGLQINGFVYGPGGYSAFRGFPTIRFDPRWSSPAAASPSPTSTRCRRVRHRAGLAQHHVLQGAV